jgi:hypothetical protein
MNLNSIKNKKSLKIVTLLISAIIIGMVSATTFNYMYLDGSVTVGGTKMVWIAGADAPGDISSSGSTVTMDLDVQNGTYQVFTEALFLKNQDTGNDHDLNITVTTELSTGDFDTANAIIYENTTTPGVWTEVGTLTLTTASDQISGTLTDGGYYRFTFEIQAKSDASGIKPFDLQVTYV